MKVIFIFKLGSAKTWILILNIMESYNFSLQEHAAIIGVTNVQTFKLNLSFKI